MLLDTIFVTMEVPLEYLSQTRKSLVRSRREGISLPLKQLLGIILVLNRKSKEDRVSLMIKYTWFSTICSSVNYSCFCILSVLLSKV